MPREIERKFLVLSDAWRIEAESEEVMEQGYLARGEGCTVRIRMIDRKEAWLTLKGRAVGISRAEYEYPVPAAEALELLDLCEGGRVEKTRYRVPHGSHVWEIDVFAGANAGLIVAEVELGDESEQPEMPAWVGREVTGQARYFNSRLVTHPYREWTAEERGE